ncbi:hypothetical protein CK203_107328 [Vitis vinifera]|uniref:Retrotransposon gag domain-containing protein n=1 Tax=Vitis vinifera TaxID=29760 RepID=A0A438CVQ8_VITVI|nr:hypothetical protein CK203_107328 [Vitis vinifera]
MSDELASTLASIQEFMAGVSRRLDQIESSRQDHHPVGISTDDTVPHVPQIAQVFPPGTSHSVPFHLSNHCETTPPPAVTVSPPMVPTIEDTRLAEYEAKVERLESMMRQIRLQDRGLTWDDRDGIPAASLPAKFRMPDIERYSGIGCPKIHLRLYNTVMRAHGIDDAQLVALFPMSLSGAAQRWFASTRVGGHQAEANEYISSFVTRWRTKVVGMIDRPKEQDQIDMVLRNLQPRCYCFPDSKGKKPIGSFSRSGEVGAISYQHWRPAYHSPYRPPPVRAHFPYPQYQYQPDYVQEPYIAQTGMQPRPPHSRVATHPPSRPYAQRPVRQFTPLGMTLTRAFEKLRGAGLIVPLAHAPLPHHIPPHFCSHENCLYHQIQGHDTECCSALHHAIQDLIDSGLVDLAGPSVTTNLCLHILHMQFLLLLVFSRLICILRVLMAWYFGTSRVEGWD